MKPMANNGLPLYEDRDVRIIASNIFHEICLRDEGDRTTNRPSTPQDLRELSKRVGAFSNSEDVRLIAEDYLAEELKYIERNPHNFQAKLTKKGRENCSKGIEIPPSDTQIRDAVKRAIAQNPLVFDRLAEL
jgi:hypothetical protein